jgi:transposase-like protein
MAKQFTVKDFFARFPDDNACLDHLMKVRYGERHECPKCGKVGRFVRLPKEPAFCCPTPRCGHHIHPMVGTPFEKTHTALSKWFYAMYLFTTSRHGVPAKELQRQLGLTYKTAWRMGHEIRKYLAKVDGDTPLGGDVEADETYIGGRRKVGPSRKGSGRGTDGKTIVMGMIERGGEVITRIVENAGAKSLVPPIQEFVSPDATLHNDEWHPYKKVRKLGYRHETVNHSKDEWVRGSVHTNTIGGFWSILKRSIRGTHVHVSRKHLAKYLGEFEFCHNFRKHPEKMFQLLLLAF